MRHAKHVLLVSLLAISAAPGIALGAQGNGRGHANGRGAVARDEAIVIDRDGHRRIVHDYYRTYALPPGLEKQLHERGELPPGLQKRLTAVPSPLAARLQGLPPYYSRYFAGTDLLIVDTRSNRIVSVIPNIF